jgi:hypothetical protein
MYSKYIQGTGVYFVANAATLKYRVQQAFYIQKRKLVCRTLYLQKHGIS